LFIDAETVREHQRLYQKAGVAGVLGLQYEGSEPALNGEQLVALGKEPGQPTLPDGEGSG
jgi:hypothetical protein